jgi:hypothetical protein
MASFFRSKWIHAVSVVLLVLWIGWWGARWVKNRELGGPQSFAPGWTWMGDDFRKLADPPSMCCDFDINYFATREWCAGSDPYKGYGKSVVLRNAPYVVNCPCIYDHPPFVLRIFSWCKFVSRPTALLIWLSVLTGIATLGAIRCWRSRKELGLTEIAWPVAIVAVLFSYPVLLEMERGNWNMLVLLAIVPAVWALRKQTAFADIAAGCLLGAAAWIKMYPGLLFFGLLALRRWRAAAACGVVGLAIGLADIRADLEYAHAAKASAQNCPDVYNVICHVTHTLGGTWKVFCSDLHLRFLGKLPGTVGWMLLILPVVAQVSYRVSRAADPARLYFPYLIWLTAAGTYLPAIANDYSLIFLPLTALAVWDRKDPWPLQVLMLPVLLWWQPLALPVSGKLFWYAKLLSLAVVAVSLQRRAREQRQVNQAADFSEEMAAPMRMAA